MPLRVFRMSLFRSWSVQVAGKQAQSLSGNFSAIPTSTYLLPCCTIISFLNFKAVSESRLESSSVHKLFGSSPVASNASNIGSGWCCCVLPGSVFSLCLCQTNQLVLSTPPSNFDVIIDCSHLPQTQRLEELHHTSGLLWPSRCTCSVGLQIPEPNRNSAAWPVGAWQPDNGAPPFCFFFYSPTEDDVYVIDFFWPTPLSNNFPLQCTKQHWVQAWSMHCFSFSITLQWAEDTKGYVGEVWQGGRAELLEAPFRLVWIFMGAKVRVGDKCMQFFLFKKSWSSFFVC